MSVHGTRRPAWFAAATAACLFLIIVGAKWSVFFRYGSPMPDWDQWDAEAGALLIPWFEKHDFLRELFHPHNEHRVVVTKLQTLALTLANGQWDSRLLAVFNAVLHSAIGVAFWLMLRRRVAPRWHALMFLLVVALFALPFAWQNILGGFHSQQYWLVALSLVALAILPYARPWSAAWWAAVVAAAVALLTMGSGFLAAAVAVLVVAFRAWRRQVGWREAAPTLVVALAIVVVGLVTRVEHPGHAGLKAQSVSDFVLSTLHSMEWPLRGRPWSGPILWLPWLWLLWLGLSRNPAAESDRGAQTIAALGGWTMLQILATSYARGVGADYPASRYMDTLAIGALANGAALAWIASRVPLGRLQKAGAALLAALWVALVAAGMHREIYNTFRFHLPDARKYYNNAENHLRGYLATNDVEHFKFPDIPYPSADGLIDRLNSLDLRAVMPAVVRAPLPLAPAAAARPGPDGPTSSAPPGSSGSFLENYAVSVRPEKNPARGISPQTVPLDYVKTWGSFGADGPRTTGEWRSAPISSPLGAWLKFETAGQIGEPGVALELRDAATDARLADVKPSRIPGNTWRAAYVRAPARPFVVVARDTSTTQWMAFGAPVEFGTLSYWAWWLTKQGLLLLVAGIAGSVMLAGFALLRRRTQRKQAGSADGAAAVPANDLPYGA